MLIFKDAAIGKRLLNKMSVLNDGTIAKEGMFRGIKDVKGCILVAKP